MMLTVNVTIFQWQSKCLVFIKSMKFVNQKDFPDILANIYWKSFVVFCFCLCKYARFDSSIISSLSRSRSRHSLTLSLCVCVDSSRHLVSAVDPRTNDARTKIVAATTTMMNPLAELCMPCLPLLRRVVIPATMIWRLSEYFLSIGIIFLAFHLI